MSEVTKKPDMCAVWEGIQKLGGIKKAPLSELEKLAREHGVEIHVLPRGSYRILPSKSEELPQPQHKPISPDGELFIPHARV
jgi:hypothetical protein